LTLANLAVRVGPLGGDDTDDLSILIGKIHDTTLDAALWNQTLRKAAGFVGGPNTALWSKDAGDVSGGDVHGAIRRILDLAPPERAKLTGKLNDWHELDFVAFRKDVKRAFHADIPVRERGEWEGYLPPRMSANCRIASLPANAKSIASFRRLYSLRTKRHVLA
jgi:hypothetical protein